MGLISAILLVYTAIVQPVNISFYWNAGPCEQLPTLNFDTVGNSCMIDFLLAFVTLSDFLRIIEDFRESFAHVHGFYCRLQFVDSFFLGEDFFLITNSPSCFRSSYRKINKLVYSESQER